MPTNIFNGHKLDDHEIETIRLGQYTDQIQQRLKHTNNLMRILGFVFIPIGLYVYFVNDGLVAAITFIFTGLLIIYGITNQNRKINQGELEKTVSPLKVKYGSKSRYRLVTDDGQRFQVHRSRTKNIQEDTPYQLYYLHGTDILLLIDELD